MSESVNLPALGESVTEGTVTRWLKNVGDRVEVDEPLLEVSTDKVDTEIPSPIAGIIESILVAEDETVEVGTPLVTIGDGSGSGDSGPSADQAPADAAPTQAAPAESAPESAPTIDSGPGVGALADNAPGQYAHDAPAADHAPAPAAFTAEPTSSFAPPSQVSVVPPAQTDIDTGSVAEVPSTDAPDPAEQSGDSATAPAPATAVDPAPATATAIASDTGQASPQPAAPTPVATPAPAAQGFTPPAPAAPAAAQPAPSGPASIETSAGYVTPLVRKLANEKGIDLSTISGSGIGGRIRKEDVLAATTAAPEASASAPAASPEVETSPLRGTSVPMSRLRKVIAERAVISMQSSAQLTSVVEVDVTLVARFRDSVKADFQAKTGSKLSFLPFFALAAAEALKSFPIINASIDGDTIVYPAHENMAIAVDTERGLLTPVIRDASSLDLAGLSAQIADLAARTRENKLKPDELAGGTFTLTNTGSRGALFDTPIVFLPQSAILGTGIVVKKPVVVTVDGLDAIAIRSMVYLALSYDHRIVDGADAARFLVAVKNRLEGGDFAGKLGI